MAKMVKCSFCGKEVVKGIIRGESAYLVFGTKSVTCCDECFNKYESDVKLHRNRFTLKLENAIKANKAKYTETDIAKHFIKYCEEYNEQYKKTGKKMPSLGNRFYVYNENGCFSVREASQVFGDHDISAKDMVKTVKKGIDTECILFDKSDITRIEYAKTSSAQVGVLNQAVAFAIRFNDEKIITYKPCVTKTAYLGLGFIFGYEKSAEKQLLADLNELKKVIGSDLPIVKVKKIGWKEFF